MWFPNDINWNLKHIHARKLYMQMDLFTLSLKNKWETYLPLKTSVNIMQTKYEILIPRKQVFLQQIKYINELIHSYSLQNKYFLKANVFRCLFPIA